MCARILSEAMTLPDQLTVARAASVPLVVLLYAWELPAQRVLGDRALLRRDGDGLVRRPDRAPARRDLPARLAARPDRRQGARARGARDADRGRRLARLDGRGDRGARDPDLGPASGGDRARRRDRRARPRQAEDVGAGDGRGARRLRGRGRVGRRRSAWWALLVALVLTWVSGLDYARSRRACCAGQRSESRR